MLWARTSLGSVSLSVGVWHSLKVGEGGLSGVLYSVIFQLQAINEKVSGKNLTS